MAYGHQEIEAEIPSLRRYARALTRDVVAADDLVQDCLTRALSKMHLWQRGTDLRAWLFTILHNQYVNHVRRAVREGAVIGLRDAEPLLTRGPHQGQRLEIRDLERALAKLPAEQRAAILLVGLGGLRYEEVANLLEVPVGTIRSRLSRGRDSLRRLTGIEPEPKRAEAAPPSGEPASRRFSGVARRSEIAVDRARLTRRPQRRASAAERRRRGSPRLTRTRRKAAG